MGRLLWCSVISCAKVEVVSFPLDVALDCFVCAFDVLDGWVVLTFRKRPFGGKSVAGLGFKCDINLLRCRWVPGHLFFIEKVVKYILAEFLV
jgi:hypothetical protein